MKVQIYPADSQGCGHHRLIWPAEDLKRSGHEEEIEIIPTEERSLSISFDSDGKVNYAKIPSDIQVIVFQRITHSYLIPVIEHLRGRGVAVVVDVDDDLTAIHPNNPAWETLHPKNEIKLDQYGRQYLHSWNNLTEACRLATLVTVSAPALLPRYAAHGRGVVVPNYLADHYYGLDRVDSSWIGWPAYLASHPDDPSAVGNSISRLVAQGAEFRVVGDSTGVNRAFGLGFSFPVAGAGPIELLDWPKAVSEIGVGIAPLSDTRFNRSKSWLKPLEMSAVGVPWVGSPREEYARLAAMGCGVLARKPRDWYRSLQSLISSPSLRSEMSEMGRNVAESLRLSKWSWKHWEAWSEACKIQKSLSSHSSS